MFRHHLIFALRRLVHEKGYTLVTLIGLVTGISAFLVLFLFVANEKSFDRHIPGHQRIYRVHTIPDGGEETPWARSLGYILPASASIPDVKDVTQFAHSQEGMVKIDDQTVRLKDVLSVDENFFDMFNIRMITGDYREIAKPNVVFITEDMARKYFGHENPVEKTIEIDELQYYQKLGPYEIRGVVESIHPKTHFRFDMLASQKGGMQGRFNHILAGRLQWIYSYVKLNQEIARQYRAETILRRILLAFSLIGMLISIIGISAFSLFISQQRTKEIGIRKVNGATILEILKMLNKDFVKWVAIAFVIATPIAWYAMNKWLQNFAYKTELSWWIFALAGLLALGIALLTVSWQSWKAATRNPVEALRYE